MRKAVPRPRREKIFGHRAVPLDRNAKSRIKVYMLALMRRTEPGRAYGELTAKAVAVGLALLYVFHNTITGHCFPSYERLAEAAGCARSTVAEAIHMLERAGVLTWSNRIVRVREATPELDLFGRPVQRWRVLRTSNGYVFSDPKPPPRPIVASKSEKPTRTSNQVSSLERATADSPLERALDKLERAVKQESDTSGAPSG
jgi:hypothetical protein